MKKHLVFIPIVLILLLSGCARPPEALVITGVTEGHVYASAVSISVEPQKRVEYTATIDGQPYTLGSIYGEDGIHTLHVTATHTRNHLTNESVVQFEIDTVPPAAPVVNGVADGDVIFRSTEINIQEQSGVTYDTTIDGSPYQPGSPYTEVGEHMLSVTAHKAKNGLTSHREIYFAIENQTYTQAEVAYFLEIALGTEYGGSAPVRKWAEDIHIKVNGNPTEEDLATLNTVIGELRNLTKLNIDIVEEDENIDIYYIPDTEFKEYIPSYVAGNWGYFSYYTSGDGQIWQAKIGIDTVNTYQLSRDHLLREEFTQSLGLGNDSFDYEDSMFYQGWTLTQEFSDMDKKVIELLYRDDIRLGMEKEEILEVLKPRITG